MKPKHKATFWTYQDLRKPELIKNIYKLLAESNFATKTIVSQLVESNEFDDNDKGKWSVWDMNNLAMWKSAADSVISNNKRLTLDFFCKDDPKLGLNISSVGFREEKRNPNMLTVDINNEVLAADIFAVEKWIKIFKTLCQLTKPVFAISHPLNDKSRICSGPVDVDHLSEKIPGIYWLNFFSKELVNQAGGNQVFEELAKEAEITRLPEDGIFLRVPATGFYHEEDQHERCLLLKISSRLQAIIR